MATAEVVHMPSAASQELARFMPIMPTQMAMERRRAIAEAIKSVLVESSKEVEGDYGVIPGTKKPTLLQPGAQKLDSLFGLVARFFVIREEEDWTGEKHGGEPFFRYMISCQLWRGETIMGEAIGECNSWESKYRFRNADRKCPNCGESAIIFTKKDNWWCAKFKGGCNAGFKKDDPAITGQETGKKLNPDIFDQVNTLVKMAQKRAHVAATINATSASEFFTQDLDDLQRYDTDAPASAPAEKPKEVDAFKMRDAFAGIKADLKKITGSDDKYYQILGNHGFEKSTQITDRAKGASIYGEMRRAFKDAMDAATTDKDQITDNEILQGDGKYPD